MKNYMVIVSLILFCLLIMNCDESGDNVIGSRHHDIETAYATEPEILANGISTTRIIANVRNNNGSIAPNMRVHFETTSGTIEEYGISNYSGNAEVTLTSVASDSDITAEITAIVLDTTFSPLGKNSANPYIIKLLVPDFKADPSKVNKLKKTAQQPDYRATIYIKFLGVKLNAELDETDSTTI